MEITLGMNKKLIIEKLEMLIELCQETEYEYEPEMRTSGDGSLFSTQFITANEMFKKVREWHTGRQVQDPDSEREELISIMKCANRIWSIRNKIKNGEFDDIHQVEILDNIEDYLAQGQKINAIKYYRNEMNEKYDIEVSLRDAKEYVDNVQSDMKLRGIIKR